MTLIEILVVLAILALLMLASVGAVRKLRKSDLREDGARLAAAMRYAYDRALATGEHHRIVIDLDEETFAVQRCDGKILLTHGLDAHQEEERKAIMEQIAKMSPTDAEGNFGQLPEKPPEEAGGDACSAVKGEHGKPQKFKKSGGIGIKQVYVAHLPDPVGEGLVEVNFFPTGTAERAVVEIGDDGDDVYSIVVQPLTGHVFMKGGVYTHPEDFVSRDAEGKDVEKE